MQVTALCFSEVAVFCVCVPVHVCVVGVQWCFCSNKREKCCACCGFFRKLLSHTQGLEPRPGDRDRVWLPEPLLRLLEPRRPSCVRVNVCFDSAARFFEPKLDKICARLQWCLYLIQLSLLSLIKIVALSKLLLSDNASLFQQNLSSLKL